jgi:hypothetical protein
MESALSRGVDHLAYLGDIEIDTRKQPDKIVSGILD